MENPEGWDLLTSSLAVSNLNDVNKTWAFLRTQGLLVWQGKAQQAFEEIVAEVLTQGEITGPSEAHRIAVRLKSAGITTELATTPDPWGETAKVRLKAAELRSNGA